MQKINGTELKAILKTAYQAGKDGVSFENYIKAIMVVKLDGNDKEIQARIKETIKAQEKILKQKNKPNTNLEITI